MTSKRLVAKPRAVGGPPSSGVGLGSRRGQSIGLKEADAHALVKTIQRGLPYSALTSLAEQSGMSVETIAAAVQLPARTLARRKAQGRFTSDESGRLLRLALVFERSLDLFEGDRSAARRWLNAPAKALAGETPLAMVQTEIGAREVEDLIGRLEHGVFS